MFSVDMNFEIIFPGVDAIAAGIRTREREAMAAGAESRPAAVSSVPAIRIQPTVGLPAERAHEIAGCIIYIFKACMSNNKSKTEKDEKRKKK